MKNLFATLLVAVSVPAFADSIHVTVKGMVCSFCAQGITKKFKAEKTVESVHVNLDEAFVHLETKGKGDLSDDKIRKIITDAGYTVASIKRD